MSFSKSARTEMVISMTLAELFLMLLFVVWYGFTPVWDEAERARLADRLVELETEVTAARTQLADNKAQIADLTARLEWWRTRHPNEARLEGNTSPTTPGGGPGGRGHSKCDPSTNVLAEASVQQGQVSLRLLSRPPDVARSFETSGSAYPSAGVWLTDPPVIQGFIGAMQRVNEQSTCRWDFRLYYETKVDGFDGLEMFQTVFYLARKFQGPAPE